MSYDLAHLLSLEPIEKLRIITALEESMTSSADVILSDAERDEIHRRFAEHQLHPERALGWNDAMKMLDADHD